MANLEWYKIDVPTDEGVYTCMISGKKFCLVVQQDQISVTANRCPHAGADLSQGWCEDNKLVCPYHRHRFDIKTGQGDKGQGNYIHIYATRFKDGAWYVGIPIPWWKRLF